jgi:deoxyribonuclease-4
LHKSVERALRDGCEALQVFTKNGSRWTGKSLTDKEATLFREAASDFGADKICAHASYLINLAATSDETYKKSLMSCVDELKRCDALGIPYYVLHPGSHKGAGAEQGIKQIAASLERIYYENGFNTMTLLEVTAGQGTGIGHDFDEIEQIISLAAGRDSVGVCLDSCHMFSAGYDIVNEYDKVFDVLFKKFGDKIKVFHLNDARKPLNSRVDRHALIGKGEIGEDFFRKVVNDPRFSDILGILETPVGEKGTYAGEVALLKQFRTGENR